MKREIIILIGHGSPERDSDNTERAAEALHRLMHPGCDRNCVRVAYLQFMEPDLMEAVETAVQGGADKVIIHPFFLSSGFHVTKNIPEIIDTVQKRYGDLDIICTEPLGYHRKLAEVILERVAAVTDLQGGSEHS